MLIILDIADTPEYSLAILEHDVVAWQLIVLALLAVQLEQLDVFLEYLVVKVHVVEFRNFVEFKSLSKPHKNMI